MPSASDEFLTVAEIARTLKVNQQTVRNWIDAGKLPAVHVGRRVRVTRSDFDRFTEHGYTGAPRPSSPDGATVAQRFWDGEDHPLPPPPTG